MVAPPMTVRHHLNETGRTSSGDVLRGMVATSFRTSSIVGISCRLENRQFGPVCGRAANTRELDYCSAYAMLSRMRLISDTRDRVHVVLCRAQEATVVA